MDLLICQCHVEPMRAPGHQWRGCFQCRLHHAPQVQPLALQGELAGRDARHIEQLVDEAHEVAHLPLHHVGQAAQLHRIVGRPWQQLQPRADRGQRVAQFMCQSGEELVLAKIRQAQRVVGLLQRVHLVADLVLHAPPAHGRPDRADHDVGRGGAVQQRQVAQAGFAKRGRLMAMPAQREHRQV